MRLPINRRTAVLAIAIAGTTVFLLHYNDTSRGWILPRPLSEAKAETSASPPTLSTGSTISTAAPVISPTTSARKPTSTWSGLKQHYPVHSHLALPLGKQDEVSRIQHAFTDSELSKITDTQRERRAAVKEAFEHAWSGYKGHAWLKDEVSPISGNSRNAFGGLAATLVDSLDSLWILGLRKDFENAVNALEKISFSSSEETTINLFEYTIRYLGGFLGAYEISDKQYPILLDKAIEVGDMLFAAFDTPNRMPVTRWDWKPSLEGAKMEASQNTLVAELGSLSLEFTTLSRLSKDNKYYDAVQRITDALEDAQNNTKLPGMWPVLVDARTPSFSGDNTFTLGAMSDSLYEYLPKQHLLLDTPDLQYRKMYEKSLEPIKKHLLFRPMTKDNQDILFSGRFTVGDSGDGQLEFQVQHLGCFAGGMLALGARIMRNEDDLRLARKLTEGCIWAYNATQSGVMPEVFHVTPCTSTNTCTWKEDDWHYAVADRLKDSDDDTRPTSERVKSKIIDDRLVQGYTSIEDRRYILRPEAIESVFYLYRITGDSALLDKAWNMFTAIRRISHTPIANAAVDDITVFEPPKADRMESFWLAETLKYFFLIFSDPDVVSLDDYVLNTEAHPFRIRDA